MGFCADFIQMESSFRHKCSRASVRWLWQRYPEEHFTNVKDVKDACTNKIFEATSKVQETVDKTLSKKNAVEEKLGKGEPIKCIK